MAFYPSLCGVAIDYCRALQDACCCPVACQALMTEDHTTHAGGIKLRCRATSPSEQSRDPPPALQTHHDQHHPRNRLLRADPLGHPPFARLHAGDAHHCDAHLHDQGIGMGLLQNKARGSGLTPRPTPGQCSAQLCASNAPAANPGSPESVQRALRCAPAAQPAAGHERTSGTRTMHTAMPTMWCQLRRRRRKATEKSAENTISAPRIIWKTDTCSSKRGRVLQTSGH